METSDVRTHCGDVNTHRMETSVTSDTTGGDIELKSNATWFKYLCQSSNEALESMFVKFPELIEKAVTLVCLSPYNQDVCYCAYKFESLSIINKDFDKLYSLVSKGVCPHAENRTAYLGPHCSNADCQTQSRDSFNKLESLATTEETEIDDVERVIFLEGRHIECDTFVSAKVKPIHIAASQGRVKLVEKILPQLTGHIDKYHSCSGVFLFIPLHNAIVHNNVNTARVISKSRIEFHNLYYQALYNAMHAAAKDSVPLLKLCMKLQPWFKQCIRFTVLAVAVKFRCSRTMKFIVDNGARIDHTYDCIAYENFCKIWDSDKILTDLIYHNEIKILNTILRNRNVRLHQFLTNLVYYDNVKAVEFMMYIANERKKLMQPFYYRDSLLIRATLNNSPGMLKILLKGKLNHLFRTYDKYTAHMWASVLGFSECAEILQKASVPFDCKVVKNYPPTVAVFHKNVDSYHNSKSKLIEILSSNGYNFVCESANGISPLYMALQNKGYKYVRMLLKTGIDPYEGRNCIRRFISRRLLGELLYANVDIFRKRPDISLVSQILYTSTGFMSELGFLLRHAHTVPDSDRIRLQALESVPDIPDVVKKDICDFLTSPKTLQSMARDSIRRRYGIKIFDFLSKFDLSERFKSIITMEDSLKPYLETEFENISRFSQRDTETECLLFSRQVGYH